MAGNYETFPVLVRDPTASSTTSGLASRSRSASMVPGADAAESPLTTGANGVIAAGSIAAASAGTFCYFVSRTRAARPGLLAQIAT
jgi:hypothetical protein